MPTKNQPPMTIARRRDGWALIDERGDEWLLHPTGDPSTPLVIKLHRRAEVTDLPRDVDAPAVEQTITFDLARGAAGIVHRAALALGLRVRDVVEPDTPGQNIVFTVVLHEAIDAYRLGERTVGDPAWAREFLRR